MHTRRSRRARIPARRKRWSLATYAACRRRCCAGAGQRHRTETNQVEPEQGGEGELPALGEVGRSVGHTPWQHGQQTGAGRPLAVDPIRLAPDNEPMLWSPPMRAPWPRPSLRLRRRLALGSLVAEEGAEGECGLMTLTNDEREREEPKTQSQ
jgi:hypothetical protein